MSFPVGDETCVGLLGIADCLALAVAHRLVAVGGGRPLLLAAAARWISGFQLQFPELPIEESWPVPGVIFLLGQLCQTMTASLRAVATAATCLPRLSLTRMKKARSGPGTPEMTHAASTSIDLAWARPCLVIRPW